MFRESFAARVIALLGAIAVIAVIIVFFATTKEQHARALAWVLLFVVLFFPAILLGAIAGWLSYSRRAGVSIGAAFIILEIAIMQAIVLDAAGNEHARQALAV